MNSAKQLSITATIAVACTVACAPSTKSPEPFDSAADAVIPNATAPADSAQHLVVGDTLSLGELIRTRGGPRTYRSSNSAVAEVSATGDLVARTSGTAAIAVTSGAPPRSDSVQVHVMTVRQATNTLIAEVCPNQDERLFRTEEPIDSDVPRVHEYHDCQRLIADGAYGPVVGILAHKNVDSYQSARAFANGRLAALIIDFGFKDSPLAYPALGITAGTNCLILKSGDKPDEWYAAIVNQRESFVRVGGGHHYGTCSDSMTWSDVPAAQRNVLVVKVQKGYDMDGTHVVPPVARWDWDDRHELNYIGVKCDSVTWCEIGGPDLVQSNAKKNPLNQDLIKGYYDEQYLAARGGGARSHVWGTLLPAADGKRLKHDVAAWHHVAVMSLHTTWSAYRQDTTDFNFYVRKFLANRVSHVIPWFRDPAATGDVEMNPVSTSNLLGNYAIRINNRSMRNWYAQHRHHKSAVSKALTVRWRWLNKDEGTWYYCDPDGCCEHMGTAEK